MPNKPSSMASKLFAILGLLIFTNAAIAQTTLISPTVNNGGFESGTTGWTFAQLTGGTTDNRWEIGSAPGVNGGSSAAYITTGATGAPWTYTGTSRTSHMYQDVTFPSGEPLVTLSFYWKGNGESGWDRLLVYIAPTTVTPVSGTPSANSTTLTGATLLYTQATYTTTTTTTPYTLVTLTVPASAVGNATSSTTRRLIFTWQNDGIGTYTPPAAVDDITLTSACQGVVGTSASSVTATTATLNWTAFTGATGYNVRYKKVTDPVTTTTWATPTTVTSGTTTSLAVTSLVANDQYEYQVSATGTGVCATYSSSVLFTTPCTPATIPQSQGFNTSSTTTLPSCWTTTIVTPASGTAPAITFETSGSSPTVSAPFEGSRMVRFNSFSASSGSQIRLVALPVNTTGTSSVDVEFQWWHDNLGSTSLTTEGVQVQYSTNGTTWTSAGSFIPRVNGTNGWALKTVTLPSAAGNVGTLYVGFLFTSQFGRNCFMDAVSIKETPACGVPTALSATPTSSTTASISWAAPTTGTGTAASYEYVVSTSNTTPTTAGTSVTGTSASITGLTASTTYFVFVRTACTGSIFGAWSLAVSFTTPCTPATIPQSEGFNTSSTTTLPSCWTTTIVTPASGTAPAITFETSGSSPTVSAPFEGSRMVRFNSSSASSGSQIRLVALPVNTTGTSSVDVEFQWWHDNVSSTTVTTDGVQVQYSTNGTTWTSAGSFIPRVNGTNGWALKTVTLPSAAGNVGTLYVGFLFTSQFARNCFMDAMSIKATPQCGVPTALSATPTSSTTASISWTAPTVGVPTGYEYIVSTSNTTPTTAGTSVTGTSASITGLTASTTYFVFVRTACTGSVFSAWTASASFTTPCTPASLPQMQGFNATTLPTCWSTTIVNNPGTAPAITFDSATSVGSTTTGCPNPLVAREGSRMIKFNSYNASANAQIRLASLPVSTIGAPSVDISFLWYHDNCNYTTDYDNVKVQYSLNGTTWTTVGDSIARPNSSVASGWYSKNVTLPAAAANVSQLYVGFLFTSRFGNHCFMDSVAIVTGPSCVVPTTVNVSNVTNTTASINWTAPIAGNTPAGYQYFVSTSNTAPTGSGTAATTNSASLTSLTPNTTYYVFVRTDCGSSSFSSWSSATSFTTACDGVTLPFKESFTATTLPSCWTATSGAASSVQWQTATTDSRGASVPYAGTYFARLDVFNAQTASNPYFLRTVPINVPNGNTDLSYYYFLGSGGYTGTSPNPLQVEVSTNYGSTWTTIYSHSNSNSTFTSSSSSAWTSNTISLNSYKGQTVMLRFRAMSNYGSGTCNQGLDEIAVSLKAPSVTNSTQCGNGTPTASATSNTGATTPVFKWYTQPTGGTALTGQSGATLSNYSISATTTFYVSEVIGNSESERVAITATYNPQPVVSITSSTDVTCFGGNNGSATVTATGGSSYNYSWNTSPVQTTATATNLVAGSYTVTVTNSNNTCPATATATITQPTQAASIPAISTQPVNTTVCSTATTSFTAAATGLNITYQWQTNNGGTTFSNISNGGNYSGATSATLTISNAPMSMNGYRYRVVASGTCSPAATSDSARLTVNATIPSISAAASATTICAGTGVTFTATPTNGGTAPVYQWKVNGSNVGTNSATYSSSTLANGDVVTVAMSSNATCAIPATVSTTGITMTVNPIVTPSVTITRSTPSNTICANTSVTFTATPVNGGSSPFYQWKINGVNTGTNSSTFTTATLNNNDIVSVQMTSNAPCPTVATVSSNNIQMTVIPIVTPTISIAASNTNICAGTSVTFTATISNGGSFPIRTWKRNGVTVGSNSNTYTTSFLSNGDVITCELQSSASCPSQAVVVSNSVVMSVTSFVTPFVAITSSTANTICDGTPVTFTASILNGGNSPSYQWKKNGVNVGTNSATYAAGTGLANGDVITCTLTTSVMCYTSQTANSNSITMTVNPILVPSITAIASNDTICDGSLVSFTTTTINPGTSPVYQWKLNGLDIANANSNTYSSLSLNDGDKISVELTSNAVCVSPATTMSNTITMKVNPLLTPSVRITADDPDSSVCNGTAVTFTASHVNGGVFPQYQWIVNGVDMVGAIANTFSMSKMSNGDVVTLRMTSTAICPVPAVVNANSIKFKVEPTTPPQIFVSATPGNKIKPGETVKFSAIVLNAGTAAKYQWTKNDTAIQGAVGTTYTTSELQNNDIIKLIVHSSLPCSDPDSGISNGVTMLHTTGLNELDRQFSDVKLYPNPNNGNFTLEAKFTGIGNDEQAKIEVLNGLGQLIFKDQVEIYGGEMKKDVRLMGVANGTYYIRLSSGDQSVVKPLNIVQ